MAKRIKNPIEVKIVKDEESIDVSIHYGVECDDGLSMRKGFQPELTPDENNLIAQIVGKALIKINEHEGLQ